MKYTLLLIILAILVIGWIIYYFAKGKKKTKAIEIKKPETPATPTSPPETPSM